MTARGAVYSLGLGLVASATLAGAGIRSMLPMDPEEHLLDQILAANRPDSRPDLASGGSTGR